MPPAAPLAYSQIPFYLTNLVDTPIIVKMIKVSRLIFSFKFSIFLRELSLKRHELSYLCLDDLFLKAVIGINVD